MIDRRSLLKVIACAMIPRPAMAAPAVSTLIGNGAPGLSDSQVNNPYGVHHRPRSRAVFLRSRQPADSPPRSAARTTTTIAGNGQRTYAGDGGPATAASLNMPHEIVFDSRGHLYIAERDNHVVRKVDGSSGVISTLAGTGTAGFSGDGGPGAQKRSFVRRTASRSDLTAVS